MNSANALTVEVVFIWRSRTVGAGRNASVIETRNDRLPNNVQSAKVWHPHSGEHWLWPTEQLKFL